MVVAKIPDQPPRRGKYSRISAALDRPSDGVSLWVLSSSAGELEERAFQLLVATLGRVLAADAGAGAAGHRGQACVGSQVPGGWERGAVADFQQDACADRAVPASRTGCRRAGRM